MAEPKIIATVPRSATEQLQISINEYKGKSYLDMRIYYTTDDGANWLQKKVLHVLLKILIYFQKLLKKQKKNL